MVIPVFVGGQRQQQSQHGGKQGTSNSHAHTSTNSHTTDYVRANHKAIRELQANVQNQRAFVDEMLRSEEARKGWKMSRFQDIKSKVADIMKASPPMPASSSKAAAAAAAAYTSSSSSSSTSSSQPSFLQRGVLEQRILDKCKEARKTALASHPHPFLAPNASSPALQQRKPSVPRAHELAPLRPVVQKNHIMENRRAAINLSSSSSSLSSSSSSIASSSSVSSLSPQPQHEGTKPHKHKAYGRIPSYLLERKQAWAAAEALRLAALKGRHSGIPPGMRLLTEDERKEALAALDAQEREIHALLLCIPLRVDTPSMARRKQALEARLLEVEGNKELFGKPRVLIKDDGNERDNNSRKALGGGGDGGSKGDE